MTRRRVWFAVALVAVAGFAIAQPSDDPEFGGRKASAWETILKEDPSPRKRQGAVVALGQLWADGQYKGSIPAVGRALLNDPAAAVRVQSATVLGQLKKDDAKAGLGVGDLAAALRAEKDSAVRRETATALGRLGEYSKDAVAPLTGTLSDPQAATRAAAADALGRIGPDARSAAPDLLPLVTDAEKAVRQAAVFALGRVAPEDVGTVGAIMSGRLKAETDADVRRELVTALGLLGDTSEAPALALASVLSDSDPEMRRQAARSLVSFGLGVRPAVPELLKGFKDDRDKNVRLDCLRTLSSGLGSAMKDLLPDLTDRLKADADFEVRVAVADEIGSIGPDAYGAISALREAQRDAQVKVREAATAAIRKVDKVPEKKY